MKRLGLLLLGLVACSAPYPKRIPISTPGTGEGPSILAVIAHPDDESAFAGALFCSAIEHGSRVDVLCITNGEGGFKYSTLAERVYGKPLTEEATGRAALPAIREQELTRALGWLGVRQLVMLGQTDHRYTQDLGEVLRPEGPWDLAAVRTELDLLLSEHRYEVVLALAPSPTTHAHHQAATLLAAEAVAALDPAERPLLLVPTGRALEQEPIPPPGLKGQPLLRPLAGPYSFDRRTRFGHRERLDYSIPILWAMAEHRSQGTLQMLVGSSDVEDYWILAASGAGRSEEAQAWLDRLSTPTFPQREYGASAGTNASALPR